MSNTPLPTLPLGLASFPLLRQKDRLYVDKTDLLQKLIETGDYYFLSRPRRFGKSLTISTLEAMFRGQTELFSGLACEAWVAKQAWQKTPVLSLDFSTFDSNGSAQALHKWLNRKILSFANQYHIPLKAEDSCSETLDCALELVSKEHGLICLLIDEYDSPILDNLFARKQVNDFRALLRSFYKVVKGCGKYLSFVFITGVSKFTKTGIFSALNNLNDISMTYEYGSLTGYTQEELEKYFCDFIEQAVAKKIMPNKEILIQKIRNYYDGFSFNGYTKVYNPFSILNFFNKYTFDNYWYESGSMSVIENYFKDHKIKSPDQYHLVQVDSEIMAPREIEEASPESFLFQTGYLTIVKRDENILTLDYPNQEVKNSLAKMFLHRIYQIPAYGELGRNIWEAVRQGNLQRIIQEYNAALAALPYHDFLKNSITAQTSSEQRKKHDESFFRSLFLMLLRGAGIQAHGEVPTCRGRSDVLVESSDRILLIEFKLAASHKELAAKRREGEQQIRDAGYLEPYATASLPVSHAVFVINAETRQASL